MAQSIILKANNKPGIAGVGQARLFCYSCSRRYLKIFFKKKTVTPQQRNFGELLIQIATELYRSVGAPDGSSSISAELEFDAEQRIAGVNNLTVDGQLRMPPSNAIEAMNNISRQLANAPEKQKLKTLSVEIKDGQVNTKPTYRAN